MIAKRKRVAKERDWWVYAVKHPMDIEIRPFGPQGKTTGKDGWFWIHRGD